MKYTTFYVKQLDNRKGNPWQARAKYKDVYGKWKEVSQMLPEAKDKKEATRMAREWFEQLNAEADLMPNAGKVKTVDEIYKEYLKHQLDTGEIERRRKRLNILCHIFNNNTIFLLPTLGVLN